MLKPYRISCLIPQSLHAAKLGSGCSNQQLDLLPHKILISFVILLQEHMDTLICCALAILQKRVSGIGMRPLHRGFSGMTDRTTNRKLHDFSRQMPGRRLTGEHRVP